MPDFHGPIQHVSYAATLWTILAWPLLAALFGAWRALFVKRADDRLVAWAAIGAMAASLIASVAHAGLLAAHAEDERFFVEHLWRMVRVGQLDASFDLALDPLSSTMALVVTGVGLPIFVFAAAYMERDAAYARFFAWLSAFAFAMLLLVLADNFLLLFFGWEGVGLCSWGLIGFWWREEAKGRAGNKAFLVNRIGDAGFVLGIALLYWGLGGSWAGPDYVPDLNARFSSVEVTQGGADADDEDATHAAPSAGGEEDEEEEATRLPSTDGKGLLTMTTYSGAVVFMDDARTPLRGPSGAPLRAPFVRFEVKGGLHSFRIHPGTGLDDFLVTHVAFGGGREIALTPFGPSVTFRNVRDQLVARDARGQRPALASLLEKRASGNTSLITIACLLLFLGAVAKSAQIPLFVWLPDAMAGPTPVSALIHAATMVTAGVYLLARLSFLFVLSPGACTVIAIVGATTALLAAVMGLYQYDVKRILAYSTVSQLGYMILAAGVGAYAAGVFHLVTHAFFKALLFLSAGALIHAMHAVHHDEAGAQDVRNMGGLAKAMPRTALAYRIGCLAITAAPIPGLAGFWSKDDVLVRAFTTKQTLMPGPVLGVIALVAVGITSFYVWRSWYLVFEGAPREAAAKVHEPPRAMTGPLAVLAVGSIVAGAALGIGPRLIGREGETALEEWLAPSLRDARAPFAAGSIAIEWGVIAAAYGVALAGWWLAKSRYAERAADWEARERRSPIFAASHAAFGFDALYDATVVALARGLRDVVVEIDRRVVDGMVHFAALATRVTAWLVGRIDDDVVDGAVRGLSAATLAAGGRLRRAQTGRIQSYVLAIAAGILALAFLQYWLR